jgi:hypothetical protein
MEHQLPSLDVRDIMPVGLEASRAAIVCGNESTPELLVSEFRHAEGTYGFVQVSTCNLVTLSYPRVHLSGEIPIRPLQDGSDPQVS